MPCVAAARLEYSMILPFVRELLADLEHSDSFERVRRHLSLAAGRRRVSGLTSTARALHIPLFAKAAQVPVVVVVADNKAADALQLAVRAACELTGAIAPERVLRLPAHDVLPFENLSPHPDVQEQRATVLWKIANGDASIVIAPVEAASLRLFPANYYLDLARVLRRGEEIDVEELLGHLSSVGYTAMDIVEMPGQFTRRGGILDIYSPEADRPVRIELFGDEIESMRKFDPDSQRSSSPLDETTLLPLTETPVTERLLAAVHARLSGTSLEGDADETVERAISAGGVTVFPGWEFFSTIAGATGSIFDLFPRCQVFVEEPAMVKNQLERWWNKVEQRHDRSNIGSLITPADVYLRPEILLATLESSPGLDIDQLGAVDVLDEDTTLGEVAFASRPTLRFHGSIPALIEQLKTLMEQSVHMLLTVPNQGEVERLANLLREYGLPYRLGSRAQHAGSENIYDESSYLAGDLRTPIIVRAPIANGVSFPDANLVLFGANDLTDEADVTARPVKKSKTAAFVSDFRDLTIGDYVVHVEHGIARYLGLKEIEQDGVTVEFMILEFAEQARLYVPLTRLDLIQKYRSTESAPLLCSIASARSNGPRPRPASRRPCRTWPTSCSSSTRSASPPRATPFRPTTSSSASSKTPSTTTRPTTSSPPSPTSSATWNPPCRWTACSAATSATARPRSPCARPSKPCRMASKLPCSHRRRYSAFSTSRPSKSVSGNSRSRSK